jgi:hypothetical protein
MSINPYAPGFAGPGDGGFAPTTEAIAPNPVRVPTWEEIFAMVGLPNPMVDPPKPPTPAPPRAPRPPPPAGARRGGAGAAPGPRPRRQPAPDP